MADNELIQVVSIRALAHLAETRDPETGNHILRTQGYVRELALRLREQPRFSAELSDRSVDLIAVSYTHLHRDEARHGSDPRKPAADMRVRSKRNAAFRGARDIGVESEIGERQVLPGQIVALRQICLLYTSRCV